jgi:hypothetical protein
VKQIIGGLFLVLLLVPIKTFGYALTQQEAVQQPCTTVANVVSFLRDHNDCQNSDRVQYYLHLCAGERLNNAVADNNTLAMTMLCPSAVVVLNRNNQVLNRNNQIEKQKGGSVNKELQEDADDHSKQFEEQVAAETTAATQARQPEINSIIISAFNEIISGAKFIAVDSYKGIVYISSIKISMKVLYVILVSITIIGTLTWFGWWLGGGR